MTKAEMIKRLNVSSFIIDKQREIFIPLEYFTPRTYNNQCRYRKLRRLRDNDSKKLYHESWNTVKIDESSTDQYYTVDIDTENRLDIIANSFYKTSRYWWVIAIANNIIDPFDVPVGTYLRIPDILSLYNTGGIFGDD